MWRLLYYNTAVFRCFRFEECGSLILVVRPCLTIGLVVDRLYNSSGTWDRKTGNTTRVIPARIAHHSHAVNVVDFIFLRYRLYILRIIYLLFLWIILFYTKGYHIIWL